MRAITSTMQEMLDMQKIMEGMKKLPPVPLEQEVQMPEVEFSVHGADRQDPGIRKITEYLLAAYPDIQTLIVTSSFQDSRDQIRKMNSAGMEVDSQDRYAYSPALRYLVINLDPSADSTLIIDWLKDFPHKDQLLQLELIKKEVLYAFEEVSHLNGNVHPVMEAGNKPEGEVGRIAEFLKAVPEIRKFYPQIFAKGNLEEIAGYIMDNASDYDCWYIRKAAGIEED